MKDKEKLLVGLVCVLLLGIPVFFFQQEQPGYHGRSLNEWLAVYLISKRNGDEAMQLQAVFAVQHIGTNGFPWLLRSLKAERPKWKWQFYWMVDRIDYFAGRNLASPLLENLDRKEQIACYRSVAGFEILGPRAASVVSEIAQTAQQGCQGSTMAVKALELIGPQALSELLIVSTNSTIPRFMRDQAREAILKISSGASAKVPSNDEHQIDWNNHVVDTAAPTDAVYTVEGNATYDTFGRGAHLASRFTLTVSNRWWALETVAIPPSEPKNMGTQVCDGITYVKFWSLPTSPSRSEYESIVVMDHTGMPDAHDPVVPVIWVAYAGQFYLPPGTNGLLRPFWQPRRMVQTNAFVAASWNLFAPQSPSPDSIEFYYDSEAWDRAFQGIPPLNSPGSDPAGLPHIARFQTFGRTNVDGRTFPLACVLELGLGPSISKVEITNVVVRSALEQRLFDTFVPGISVVKDLRREGEFSRGHRVSNASVSMLLNERKDELGP